VDEDMVNSLIFKDAIEAMKEEILKLRDADVSKHFAYIMFQPASEKKYVNGVRDKGNSGMRLKDFVSHEHAVTAKLTVAEVAALWLAPPNPKP
jgi:hypothetical protein